MQVPNLLHRVGAWVTAAVLVLLAQRFAGRQASPVRNIDLWQQHAAASTSNDLPNCYCYAQDVLTHSLEPGHVPARIGLPIRSRQLSDLTVGLSVDGQQRLTLRDVADPPDTGVIVIAYRPTRRAVRRGLMPASEFHFVRVDRDGKFSHKRGSYPPETIRGYKALLLRHYRPAGVYLVRAHARLQELDPQAQHATAGLLV